METDHHLRQQLKQLKLSGILETLEMRILECRQNDIDYKNFLSLLLQDEIELRFNRRIQRLITQAGFGVEKTLESFDQTLVPGLNRTQLRELAICSFVSRAEGVLITGPPGTGKTHLAKALGHNACRRGMTVSFFKFNALFTELARAKRLDRIESLIDKLARIDLLIIDDFAFRRIDQHQSEWLYEIVDRRYGTRSMVLTSNRALGDWMGVFPDPVIAGAILDRLTHHAHQIELKGESIRKKLGLAALHPTIETQPQAD